MYGYRTKNRARTSLTDGQVSTPYACGSPRYMDAVYAAAEAKGWPEAALHKEYFTVPEAPDYVNHPFRVQLAKTGRTVEVPADKPVTEAERDRHQYRDQVLGRHLRHLRRTLRVGRRRASRLRTERQGS